MSQFRCEIAKDTDVIARFETRRQDERFAADPVQYVFQFRTPISGVYVDQYQPCFCCGKLSQYPFRTVLRPNPDPFSGLQSVTINGAVSNGMSLAHWPIEAQCEIWAGDVGWAAFQRSASMPD
jgi:hypothetical protein